MGEHQYVGALDQGTTSTRFILFDHDGKHVASHQIEHKQHYPRPGYVEHDPTEIWEKTQEVIRATLRSAGVKGDEISGIGITNQRETTVVWNPKTGKPWHNAIVWQDTRTGDIVKRLAGDEGMDRFRALTGLPLATYFAGPKVTWLLENDPEVRKAAERGEAVFGTMDSYVAWWLTGGPDGGRHVTDPTNASRTLLMDIRSLEWDHKQLDVMGIPASMLPTIEPSIPTEPYGYTQGSGPVGARVPLAGILGDQQAALFGQACYEPGTGKNTYGTGCFLLLNTGEEAVLSKNGLITTVGYQFGGKRPVYALEGAIAIAGSLVQWIRDNFEMIESSPDIEKLAATVEDNGGVYFVPAFSGLFAPYWDGSARGVIAGLTGFARKGHLARAVLESTAYQTVDIFHAMAKDSGVDLQELKVDGGMVVNELLMQFQADMLGIPVIRPQITETTALGAAYAAGLSTGFWENQDQLAAQWQEDKRWVAAMDGADRKEHLRRWGMAVEKSRGWQ
jgi:glycerol kinase